MLLTPTTDSHPDYPQQFKDTVRYLFPILCYTPEQIDDFIREFEPGFDGKSHVIEDEHGRLTFCRYAREGRARFIDYIIPPVWEDRYTMVKSALLQLRDDFLATDAERSLVLSIDEKLPSHTAYYAGLLPELGFNLEPRVTMTAPLDLLEQLALPTLAPNIAEIPYQEDQLQAAIAVYGRAHEVNAQELSAEQRSQMREDDARYIAHVYGLESTRQTWTGIAFGGELIGFSFGEVSDERLSLEEVAVVPEYQGQGLGAYLTIRCLQKLYERKHEADTYFFLGTARTWTRALSLYQRLGFSIDKVQLYAILKKAVAEA